MSCRSTNNNPGDRWQGKRGSKFQKPWIYVAMPWQQRKGKRLSHEGTCDLKGNWWQTRRSCKLWKLGSCVWAPGRIFKCWRMSRKSYSTEQEKSTGSSPHRNGQSQVFGTFNGHSILWKTVPSHSKVNAWYWTYNEQGTELCLFIHFLCQARYVLLDSKDKWSQISNDKCVERLW